VNNGILKNNIPEMLKLKIAQLAPPWLEVPPKKYGGTELIIHHLTEGLIKKGHEVTLFASGDSETKAKLVSVFPEALYWKGFSWDEPYGPLLHTLSCFEDSKKFDIIHNHFHFWGICLSALTKTKVITTYHGDFNEIIGKKTVKYQILKKFKHSPFIAISKSQRKIQDLKLNFVATIYNGIDIKKFQLSEKQGKYLAWLGRITSKKGILEAIKIAKKVKIPLKIAAKIDKNYPPDIEFYKKKVKPLIDGKKIIYVGEIGGYREKSNFLKDAIALLNPIKWEEPFGLVMPEAMACGTPVIVFDKGAAREVVKDGKTGFVVKNISQAIEALQKIEKIKRRDCRLWVEKKFSKERMIDEYEKLYYKILRKK